MSFFKSFSLVLALLALSACSTTGKTYENQVFPKGKWQAVNTQNQTGAWQ